jgi:iron complex outermembrane receptor protein
MAIVMAIVMAARSCGAPVVAAAQPPARVDSIARRAFVHDSLVRDSLARDSLVRRSLLRDSVRTQVLGTVRITAVQGGGPSLARPASVLEGRHLDRRPAPSIAATLAGEPGVTARSNGPMATQPVIRGLSGDRVLVLEDGQRTGDISTTAPDHAVTIDPMTARRIEVVRGPAGLLFGSNSLGGVINVVRDDVPSERHARLLAGSLGVQGESMNNGGVAHAQVRGGLGPFSWRTSGSWRTAGDTRTPTGTLPFSDMRGHDVGAGAALVDIAAAGGVWRLGAAARDVATTYGVPGSFGGVVLPGAHEGGVYVDLTRRSGRLDASWRAPTRRASLQWWPEVMQVTASSQYVRFEQSELERGGFVGTRFGQLMSNTDALAQYQRRMGMPVQGSIGVWHQWRDFRAEGSYTGTRPGVLRSSAVFMMEEWTLDSLAGAGRPLRLQWGLRVDRARITPLDSTETRLVRNVRTRAFTAPTGSVGLTFEPHAGITVGASATRAFRPPAIEELFSAGPHLATYAYEVGNPELRDEHGTGGDLFLRVERGSWRVDASAFVMGVRDFIYQRPLVDSITGEPVRDQRLRRYNVYQADQADARMHGAEARVTWRAPRRRGLSVDGTLSWVRGMQRTDRAWTSLPAMPPLRARTEGRWEGMRWSASLGIDAAARQSRVPAAPFTRGATTCSLAVARGTGQPTDLPTGSAAPALLPAEFCGTSAWMQLQGSVGRRWTLGAQLHEITLSLENALDIDWRDHLWRAKQVAPQPGRNLRVLYRWSW